MALEFLIIGTAARQYNSMLPDTCAAVVQQVTGIAV